MTASAGAEPRLFDKWGVLDSEIVAWDPHPGQLLVAENTARHRVVSAGRRFGKSNVGGYELVAEAMFTLSQKERLLHELKRREFWIVGPEYCADDQTEILTDRGWRTQDQLKGTETVLTLSMESGLAEWQQMNHMSVFHTLPGLHRHVYESSFRGHSSVTTGEHRWPIRSGRHGLLKWAKTEGIGSSRDRLMTVTPVSNLPTEQKYTDAMVELVAWYWTEGTWSKDGQSLEIAQNEGAHYDRIRAACHTMFGPASSALKSKRYENEPPAWREVPSKSGRCAAVRLNYSAARAIRDGVILKGQERDKKVDPRFITELTQSQLELFIKVSVWADGMRDWDGVRDVAIGQRIEHGIDILHMACQLAGRRASKYIQERFGGAWYALGIYSENKTGEVGTNSLKRTQVKSNHEGVVWCPNTPNGTWLMRRNGHVAFTGNSDAEKEFRVLWDVLEKRLRVPFDRPGSYNNPESGQMSISLWDGTFQVHAKSSKYPDSLVGEGLSGVIMSEAAKQKPSVWIKYIRPTLSDFNGWSLHTSTPEGKNHFYEKYQWGRDPGMPDWMSWRMPAWVNPYVYRDPTKAAHVKKLQEILMIDEAEVYDEIEEANKLRRLCIRHGLSIDNEILDLMASMTTEAFNQEIGADFTEFVGRVFKQFDEEIHVGDLQFNPKWETYAGVDYGFTNPNVWLLIQVGPHQEINVIDEIYEPGLDADDFAKLIEARGMCPGNLIRFYPDPSSPGDSNILSKRLRKPFGGSVKSGGQGGSTGGDLRPRLDAIRKALKTHSAPHMPLGHEDRRPQIMWDRRCKMSIHEMQEYRYPDRKEQNSTKAQELPLKEDDHTPEALGRFFAGHFGTPQEASRSTRQRKGNFKR